MRVYCMVYNVYLKRIVGNVLLVQNLKLLFLVQVINLKSSRRVVIENKLRKDVKLA